MILRQLRSELACQRADARRCRLRYAKPHAHQRALARTPLRCGQRRDQRHIGPRAQLIYPGPHAFAAQFTEARAIGEYEKSMVGTKDTQCLEILRARGHALLTYSPQSSWIALVVESFDFDLA